MTFGVWLFWQMDRKDSIGWVARHLFDKRQGVPNIRTVRGAEKWAKRDLPESMESVAVEAMKEYLEENGTDKVIAHLARKVK